MSQFIEVLSGLIQENGLNAYTLSKKLNLSDTTITRYLNGERLPTRGTLVKLADYFNCTTDYLLGLDGEDRANGFVAAPPFDERIKFLIEKSGLSKRQFCIKCKISEGSLYCWLQGRGEPYVDALIKLAAFFDSSVDYVIGREK